MSGETRKGNKNRINANGGNHSLRMIAFALVSALAILCLAPALFAQSMLPKDIGSKCGQYSLSVNTNYQSITDYGSYSAPEFVDYDADGQLELVVGYDDGDIRTFQYNESLNPKWQFDKLMLNQATTVYRKISAVDFDKDGDYDIITTLNDGDIEYYENIGTRSQPNWTLNRGILNSYQIDSNDNSNAFADVVDFNRDGLYDIFASRYYSNGVIDYFENVADEYAWKFAPYTDQFIDDIGSYTQCDFIDIDSEGVLDMICSRDSQTIYKFNNDGNISDPEWGGYESFLNTGSGTQVYFSFGDLDNDTDYDLMVGKNTGFVYYYENTGTSQNPLFGSAVTLFGGSLGSYTAPALADFDNDGDLDMLVGEDNGNVLRYYNNTGNATNYAFTLVAGLQVSVAADRPVPHAVDIDNDGDYDIVVGLPNGNIRLYNNTGTASKPSFSSYSIIMNYIGNYTAPGFGDIDNDGDYDMPAGNANGYCLVYYNIGSASSPSISTDISNFYTTLTPSPNTAYQYNSIDLVDFDNDGDHDLIVSNRYGPADIDTAVLVYENKGSDTDTDFSYIAKWMDFDAGDSLIYSSFADLDSDGDLDMFTNSQYPSGDDSIQYYENVGNEFSINWSNRISNYLGVDVGTYSAPYAVDLDKDGDLDVIIGAADGLITYMRNDGTASSPSFTNAGYLKTTAGANIDLGTSPRVCPGAADMNNDGDIDLMLGDRADSGYVEYWENNGTGYFSLVNSNVLGGLLGGIYSYACPRMADLDGDGDYDMIAGGGNDASALYMILNTGTPESPSFGSHQKILSGDYDNFWFTNDRYAYFQEHLVPALYDINNDSIIDLLVGDDQDYYTTTGGNMHPLKHYTSNTSLAYERVWGNFGGQFPFWVEDWTKCNGCDEQGLAPAFADLNNDGKPELLVGRTGGQVELYWNYGKFRDNTSIMKNMAWIPKTGSLFGGDIAGISNYDLMDSAFYDVDNDNDLDALVWTGYTSGSYPTYTRLFLIRNQGTPTEYSFNPNSNELIFEQYNMECPTTGYPFSGGIQLVDFNNDGKMDIGLDTFFYYGSAYREGKTKILINNGTINSASFQELAAGNQDDCTSDNMLPFIGYQPSSAFFDADGDGDYDALECSAYRGYCIVLENKGAYSDPVSLADNSRFIKKMPGIISNIHPTTSTSNHMGFRVNDFDGDGDFDIVMTSSDTSERLRLYENQGTNMKPRFVATTIISDLPGSGIVKPIPAVGDMNNDGDNDIIYGYDDGILGAYENQGNYQNNTCVTIVNSTLGADPGATVVFRNSSGYTFCTATTDSKGRAQCNMPYTGDEANIFVSGIDDPYKVLVSAYVDSGKSSTNSELDILGTSTKISLNKMLFSVFSPGDYTPVVARVDISDSNQTMFNGITNISGKLNAWLPKKYLEFRNEPYTQNRITYNIEVFANDKYGRVLELEDVYTPNYINLSSATESSKLYKFPGSEQMTTGARYRAHVIYPAYTAQQKYNISDTVNGNLTIVGNVTVTYNGEICQIVPNPHNYTVSYTDKGCEFLADAVEGTGDWVKVEYVIETPSLATFQTNGWSTQDFISQPATIKLIS